MIELAPYLDRILFFKHTRTWKERVRKIRKSACDDFIESLKSSDIGEKIIKIKAAENIHIFNEHRSNWFGFGATTTVKNLRELRSQYEVEMAANMRSSDSAHRSP